jgi:hypothetical protein
MTLSYLHHFKVILHYELQDRQGVLALQNQAREQVMEIAGSVACEQQGRAAWEKQGIAAAVVCLYENVMPRLIASDEHTPLLIRTCIRLIQWHSEHQSDGAIEEHFKEIGRNFTAVEANLIAFGENPNAIRGQKREILALVSQ